MSRKLGRCLNLELLARREVCAADATSLPCARDVSQNRADVNGDSIVSPADVAAILEILNGQRQNPMADVNCDGSVTPLDLLKVINQLNQSHRGDGESSDSADSRFDVDGSGVIDARDAAVIEHHLNVKGSTRLPSSNDELYEQLAKFDVNEDGYITPLDVLQIGNEIARRATRDRTNADGHSSSFVSSVDALFSDDLITSEFLETSFLAS